MRCAPRLISHLARATEGSSYRPASVGEALDHYEADLRARDADPTNAARVRKHLPSAIAAKTVNLLTAHELPRWRDHLIQRKGLERGSADRTARALKAALNLAAKDDPRISNAAAWRTGLARLPDGERARNVVIPETSVRALIAGAYEISRSPEPGQAKPCGSKFVTFRITVTVHVY